MTTKEQVKQLWRLCFDDDEAFVDLYFRLRYTDRINKVVEDGGRVVSALQMIPYPMTFCGETVPVAYISGACTHPDFRARGMMSRLLQEAHRAMYEEGKLFSTLIPAEEWLKGYYARSGYAVCFRYGVETKVMNSAGKPVDNSASLLKIKEINLSGPVDESVYAYFNEQMNRRACCVQHVREDFHIILADLSLAGGFLYDVRKDGRKAGLVFGTVQGETVKVKELLLTDEADKSRVLELTAARCRAEKIECILPYGKKMYDLGMARVINAGACLSLFARTCGDKVLHICLTGDEALPVNNGFYTIEGGRCVPGFRAGVPYENYTVPQLTALMLAGMHPYMSLMLD